MLSKIVQNSFVWGYIGLVSASRLVTRRLSAEDQQNLVWDQWSPKRGWSSG
jgi:hypothetical protein